MIDKFQLFNKNMPTSKKLLIIFLIAGCAISLIFSYFQYRDENDAYERDIVIKFSDTEVCKLPPRSKTYKVPYRSATIEIALLTLSYSVASSCSIFSIYFFITRLKRLKWWKTYVISLLFTTGVWFFITALSIYSSYYTAVYGYNRDGDWMNYGIFKGYILGYLLPKSCFYCFFASIFVFIIVFFILSLISLIVNFKNKKAKAIESK